MAQIKGVNRKVIEITNPQHEFFEKVYVVLKADCPGVKISVKKSQAEKYVANLVCYRRSLLPFNTNKLPIIPLCIGALAIFAFVVVFIL